MRGTYSRFLLRGPGERLIREGGLIELLRNLQQHCLCEIVVSEILTTLNSSNVTLMSNSEVLSNVISTSIFLLRFY